MSIQQEFACRHKKWTTAAESMPFYSKSTAYTDLSEYRDIVALGPDVLPLLLQKLKANRGMDFLLVDAIIEIQGWDPEDFPQTDIGKKRLAVIEALDKRYGKLKRQSG